MNVKVYYVSSKGCAEAIAEAIARECRCPKEALMPAYPPENVAMRYSEDIPGSEMMRG